MDNCRGAGEEPELGDFVWLFGYGSLIWRPDFPYLEARRAYVAGWTRRFWQGSHDHRGVKSDPGRTVTLVEATGERCYGLAYLIEPDVFEHLDHREMNGYRRHHIDICLADAVAPAVVYIGSPTNFAFLGEAPLVDIAAHIRRCAGRSGTNVDYLNQLACALRRLDISDPHVFELEKLVDD